MGDLNSMANLKGMVVSLTVALCLMVYNTDSVHAWSKKSAELKSRFRELPNGRLRSNAISRSTLARFQEMVLKKSFLRRTLHEVQDNRRRVRREEEERQKSKQDQQREDYERRLFESLKIIGYVQATRLYVPEDDNLVPVGTVVGRVRKLHPHGKVVVVWPYPDLRNFTVNEDTGEVKTTAKMDFEFIRSYNMTIRDFEFGYTDKEPLRQPPLPDPPESTYVDHYLIVEVVDVNDNQPIFQRDVGSGVGGFSGRINQNARAGTPIVRIHPTDDDSGPRGRIRFDIVTEGDEETPFTIDPRSHILKTDGKPLASKTYEVKVNAKDYGMPPKESGIQTVAVTIAKTPPDFIGTPYNLNFSEASARGSIVAKLTALSRSGLPMSYKILDTKARETFAINHRGEITLLRELDFETANETDKLFEFKVRGKEDADEGQFYDVPVTLNLVNADDHLGMFKTPATKIKLKEGNVARGDVFAVEVNDCDCLVNCQCGSNEMIFTLGDTNGFFDINQDGQIRNIKPLDFEEKSYFFFPVKVTDPGTNGRTRTSYIELYVEDDDDTPPIFTVNVFEFFLFEDAQVGQVVGVVQAVDPDPSTEPDDVSYRIVNPTPSDGRKYFEVANQGVIKVKENNDKFGADRRNSVDKFKLEIEATDKGRKVSNPRASVTIRILDVNDHQPIFTKCENVKIKENQPIGTAVTTLTATDRDRGFNKLIEYSLQRVQKHNFFAINNGTGALKTTEVLDRESYDSIFVVAKATDGGSDRSNALRQVGYCQFVVEIEDVDDNIPEFTVALFSVTVNQNLGIGKQVLQVEAVDPDVGSNAVIKYRILSQKIKRSGKKVDLFSIELDKSIAILKVKKTLKSLALRDEVDVVIQAYNDVNKVNDKSKTTVTVSLTTSTPAVFEKSKYIATVKENLDVKANKALLRFKATPDTSVYTLQSEIRNRGDLPFVISTEKGTGIIKLRTTLDYEIKKSYLFAVIAGSSVYSSALVQINVEDVDDVVPIFGTDRYDATVSEAAKADANVFRVKATDPDPANGGEIIYSIKQEHDYKLFKVVKETGYAQIKTVDNLKEGSFDREKKEDYTIVVEAYRSGARGFKSSATILIHVQDENDSPPVFEQPVYSAEVPENTKTPYIVPNLKVRATDQDILENANVSYFITSGNDGRFEMKTIYGINFNNSGELRVVRPLDVEKTDKFKETPVYNLTVTATDRKHIATARINIRVIDRPETRPEFVREYYEKYLPENVGPGVRVVQVQVKKPSNVEYSLEDSLARSYFAINKDNGLITTDGKTLDWETTPVITFPVYAFDRANPDERGQTFVRVVLNDVNDAPPIFPDGPYVGYVAENAPPGTTVRYINGKDRDNPDVNSGNNVKLRYELLTNTGMDPYDRDGRLFTFNSQGLLVTKVSFDAEAYRRNLTLRVRAWDHGNPSLSGETDVTIVIRDVNEHPARFRKLEYEASVSETQPPGFVVLQLTIVDYDFSPRDNYAFSMLSGNRPYAFDIQQETGEIVVAGILDYENTGKQEYQLSVGLRERSGEFLIPGDGVNITRPFEDIAKVTIRITEGNDHRPTFTKRNKIYQAVVAEDVTVGTRLNVAIEATDGDTGFSNKFKFIITKGNMGDWFVIRPDTPDSNKAGVFVQYPLDREYRSVYNMEMIVKDLAGVSDTAKLIVTVTDVNDNPPIFQPSYYKATITEGGCTDNKPLATLTVHDPDKPEQGPFSFSFESNTGTGFALRDKTDNSTTLYCTQSVNRERTPSLQVVIRATDKPSPQQSSTAIVYVEVKDVEEFGSKDAKMRIIVNAFDEKFGNHPIGRTYFQDDDGDGDGNMEYSLSGSEEFFINKLTGVIATKSTVKVGKYQLKVTGTRRSGGANPTCDVDVNIRVVPSEAIEHSAAVQLMDEWTENRFMNSVDPNNVNQEETYYDRFVRMLTDLFSVSEDNVFVFSIQMATEVMPGRHAPALDVRFAIRKESSVKSQFLPRYVLINVLERNKDKLKDKLEVGKDSGFKLGMIGIDYCANETLRVGMCRNVVENKKTYSVVSSDYGLMPAPTSAVVVVSIDTFVDGKYERYKQIPDPEYDECEDADDRCLNGGKCHDVKPHGYVCECPGEYSGPQCQLTTRTFLGNSYIWLHPKTPHNYGSVSFEFATKEPNGLLLYQGPAVKGGNNGRGDFLAVSLVNGRIRVALSFGSQNSTVFDMSRTSRLDNGKWHHVEVSHQRKDVTVIVDHCKYADIVQDDERIVEKRENCELIAKTTQNYEFLNGLAPIQVGGIESMPLEYPSSKHVQYTFFRGCIRKIRENLEMYDLAYPLKVVNAPVGCTIMAKCPDCKNGGYCYPGFARSICTCPMGYVGDDCSGNAPKYWYLANSFTEYILPGEERRRKRAAANEPTDLLDRYTVHLAMQLRVAPEVKKALFFYTSSENEMEYSILGYEEQKLYFEFKLLDALTRLEMPGEVRIADDKWHNVTVTREGNFAVLQVDYDGRVSRNTGGTKQLIRMGGSKLYAGGMPNIAPNATIVDKVVRTDVTDIRQRRRRRSAGTILGVTTDGREVNSIDGDMRGCSGSTSYNGKNLDTDPSVGKVRFNVETGCPCRAVLECRNNGVCVSGSVPFCQCTRGWSGRTCEDIVYVPPVLGNRVDGRVRWEDGGILMVILVVVMSVLVLAIALFFVKKRREAPYSVPVGDEGQDSIMPYHDDGAGEEDTFNYDIHHLMKYSYRDGHGTVTKSVNGKEVAAERIELLNQAPGGSVTMTKQTVVRDSAELWPFIQERVRKADEDTSWWPGEEIRAWADEGDGNELADLSEIEESDDEAGDAEQDWEFLKDWGKKFENLNKIFNPDDDEDAAET